MSPAGKRRSAKCSPHLSDSCASFGPRFLPPIHIPVPVPVPIPLPHPLGICIKYTFVCLTMFVTYRLVQCFAAECHFPCHCLPVFDFFEMKITVFVYTQRYITILCIVLVYGNKKLQLPASAKYENSACSFSLN